MKIVEVIWDDSRGVTSGWEFKDEMEPLYPVTVRSVGFLEEENGEYITIVQSDSKNEVLGRMTIPKGCIHNRNIIKQDN